MTCDMAKWRAWRADYEFWKTNFFATPPTQKSTFFEKNSFFAFLSASPRQIFSSSYSSWKTGLGQFIFFLKFPPRGALIGFLVSIDGFTTNTPKDTPTLTLYTYTRYAIWQEIARAIEWYMWG